MAVSRSWDATENGPAFLVKYRLWRRENYEQLEFFEYDDDRGVIGTEQQIAWLIEQVRYDDAS